MGFRFSDLNTIYKPYLSRIYSTTHKKSIIAQSLTTQLQEINHSSNNYNIITNPPHYNNFKRWHFGHSHHHHHHHHHGPHKGSNKESENIFKLGLAADIGLTAGKALTGYLSGSTAIIADAAHSLSDVVLSSVALLSFKAARVPRDKEHPYGHGKFETLGALGISGMLLVTAGGIAWHAADILLGWFTAAPEVVSHSLTHEHGHHNGHSHKIDMEHPLLALNMAILSIAVKEGLFWITKRAGEKEGSGLMKANAWHHRADAISSLVALIGVGGSILGVKFLDPLAGIFVSGMILKAGLDTGYQSIVELVDAAVPQQQLDPHRETILQVEGVKVDPFTSVSAAHHIGENVRHRIHESHPEVAEVFIHIDPAISQIIQESDLKDNLDGSDENKDSIPLKDRDFNHIISGIFSSLFSKKMKVEHITPHLLQNKIMLDVEVSLPPDIMIRDAMLMAEELKKEILGTVSDVIQVHVQLRLSPPNHTTPS
ncbi:metal tolerance protein 2 isoform X2 [Beta vulgaris subsp. vulgaris]|uniref:metal tolerance protein 2 isoform X2 n=1 Tax=Beta vulgaris subsp. vulgaris TaxID=3555 RepID=UPI0020371678|nr:metal tolerance protein 2 isoform X2 [Beta vulgaris subsp. vulgaris]